MGSARAIAHRTFLCIVVSRYDPHMGRKQPKIPVSGVRNVAQQAQELDLRRQAQIARQVEIINRLLTMNQAALYAVSQLDMPDASRQALLKILEGNADEESQPDGGEAAGGTNGTDSVPVSSGIPAAPSHPHMHEVRAPFSG